MASGVISFSDKHAAEVNRKALARADPAVEEVIVTVAHSAIYDFDQPRGAWVRAALGATVRPLPCGAGLHRESEDSSHALRQLRLRELCLVVESSVASPADQAGAGRPAVRRSAKLGPNLPHRAYEPVERDQLYP